VMRVQLERMVAVLRAGLVPQHVEAERFDRFVPDSPPHETATD
jgi:hypothetical protein